MSDMNEFLPTSPGVTPRREQVLATRTPEVLSRGVTPTGTPTATPRRPSRFTLGSPPRGDTTTRTPRVGTAELVTNSVAIPEEASVEPSTGVEERKTGDGEEDVEMKQATQVHEKCIQIVCNSQKYGGTVTIPDNIQLVKYTSSTPNLSHLEATILKTQIGCSVDYTGDLKPIVLVNKKTGQIIESDVKMNIYEPKTTITNDNLLLTFGTTRENNKRRESTMARIGIHGLQDNVILPQEIDTIRPSLRDSNVKKYSLNRILSYISNTVKSVEALKTKIIRVVLFTYGKTVIPSNAEENYEMTLNDLEIKINPDDKLPIDSLVNVIGDNFVLVHSRKQALTLLPDVRDVVLQGQLECNKTKEDAIIQIQTLERQINELTDEANRRITERDTINKQLQTRILELTNEANKRISELQTQLTNSNNLLQQMGVQVGGRKHNKQHKKTKQNKTIKKR